MTMMMTTDTTTSVLASPSTHQCNSSNNDASPMHGELGATPGSASSRKRKARAWPAEKELLEQLECCICCTPMTGAIYQCMDGHLICAACKPNSALRCPFHSLPLAVLLASFASPSLRQDVLLH